MAGTLPTPAGPQQSNKALNAISSLSHYIPETPLPSNILTIVQLLFFATTALFIILGLATCITRLENRRILRSKYPRSHSLSRLEIDVGEDLQIVVVKTRSGMRSSSPTKSALFSPERKGSLGKSVRWADEIAVACVEEEEMLGRRDLEDLLV